MADPDSIAAALDADIRMTQERFTAAMEARLVEMPSETKERYFVVLSLLVGKLEDPAKSLSEILQEVVAESATLVMAELQR